MKKLISSILLLSIAACGSRLVDFPITPGEPNDAGNDVQNVPDVSTPDSNIVACATGTYACGSLCIPNDSACCVPITCIPGKVCIRNIVCSVPTSDASSNDSNTSDVISDAGVDNDVLSSVDSNTSTCMSGTFACGSYCAPNGSVCCGDGFCLPGKVCINNSTCSELISDAAYNDSNTSDVDTGTNTISDASDGGTCHHAPCTNSCNSCTSSCEIVGKTNKNESYNDCISNCNNNKDVCDKQYGSTNCQ